MNRPTTRLLLIWMLSFFLHGLATADNGGRGTVRDAEDLDGFSIDRMVVSVGQFRRFTEAEGIVTKAEMADVPFVATLHTDE